MDILTALLNRRSIRRYLPDPVSKDTVEKLLDVAHAAPSWKNQQCWRFLVITDPGKKEQLSTSLVEGNPAVKAITGAPVAVVLCANPNDSGIIDNKEYYLADSAIAMHQLMLAAHAEGLGTCWVAWFDEEKARRACAIPNDYKIVAITPLGYPEREGRPIPRKDLSEVVFWEEWGNS